LYRNYTETTDVRAHLNIWRLIMWNYFCQLHPFSILRCGIWIGSGNVARMLNFFPLLIPAGPDNEIELRRRCCCC
jgi:hypothetical protein